MMFLLTGHSNGLVQDCSNSSALAMKKELEVFDLNNAKELPQSCSNMSKPSMYFLANCITTMG